MSAGDASGAALSGAAPSGAALSGAALLPEQPLLFERSVAGRTGVQLPRSTCRARGAAGGVVPRELPLPELSEPEVVRHFTNTSRRNFSVDQGFYPLGSCTMKYNPKINDRIADLPGLALIHPYQDEATVQGALRLLWELQEWLGEIAGLPGVSLQPSAGAHGELTGALIIRAYHHARGEGAAGSQRTTMLVPDSAHGTNPATAAMAGYRSRTVPTGADGNLDFAALQDALDDSVAGLMITNPNTLGLFVERVTDIAAAVHEVGGLVYMDGANMNAMVGVARPAIWAPTSCTSICTRRSASRTAAAGRELARPRSPSSWRAFFRRRWCAATGRRTATTTIGRTRSAACAPSTATSTTPCAAPTRTSGRWAATGLPP
ncbi:Probable glycine dehydrogenase (decarboxylating) subunit 2 [Geodia barretti]|uniref:Probable glycine dehydrogenase (Decarboxylating) subunit 2 n=1 Tax=Geodia barretti TaxID=519541 RepID=A0AA35RYT4_GEOBA|nr:Probable glycine dehydrogenase (decarboxylating) subunit 2 [Geodia barretti]